MNLHRLHTYRRALAISMLSAGSLMAQQGNTPTPVTEELIRLSDQWMNAAQQHDSATLERLMAPEFTLMRPSPSGVVRRAEWLAALRQMHLRAFQYDDLKVAQYGDALAVVNGILVVDAEANGRPVTPVTLVTDVWARRAGRWVVVTRYAASAAELGPRPAPVPTTAAVTAPKPAAPSTPAPSTPVPSTPVPSTTPATPSSAPSVIDQRNAPGCAGIVARALANAAATSQPSTQPRTAFNEFEVEQAATPTVASQALGITAFAHRELLVQFVVDTTGVVDLPTTKVLAITMPARARPHASDSTRAVDALRRWRFRPAQIGGCAVPQIEQMPVRIE